MGNGGVFAEGDDQVKTGFGRAPLFHLIFDLRRQLALRDPLSDGAERRIQAVLRDPAGCLDEGNLLRRLDRHGVCQCGGRVEEREPQRLDRTVQRNGSDGFIQPQPRDPLRGELLAYGGELGRKTDLRSRDPRFRRGKVAGVRRKYGAVGEHEISERTVKTGKIEPLRLVGDENGGTLLQSKVFHTILL